MLLINCVVNLILTWYKDCVITNYTGAGKFAKQKKNLCSGCNFINGKQCKITSTNQVYKNS